MALHSIKHGFSNPIHGIVLGKTEGSSSSSSSSSLKIVDVVPVCHEVPTKPIVDMSLRLTDAYLQQQQQQQKGVKIVGWYTANANANASDNNEEMPNGSACKIASSMAEYCADADDTNEQFVLLLISTSKLVDYSTTTTTTTSTICTVYEKDTRRTFTQKVDDSRVVKSDNDGKEGLIEKAVILQVDDNDNNMMEVCDFVDHLENGGVGDWLENDKVNKFCGA